MPIPVLSSRAGKINLSPILPDQLKAFQIPGSVCLGASGSFGHFLFQQLAGEDISIRYVNLYFSAADELSYSIDEPALRLQISLLNSFYYQLEGLGDFTVHERGLTLNFDPAVHHLLQVHKEGSYASLTIYYKLEHLLPLQNNFSGLPEFLQKVREGQAASFSNGYCIADGNITLMINKILVCNYTGILRQIFLNSAAMEILVLALVSITREPQVVPAAMDKTHVEEVYKAKEWLLANMSKAPSLTRLSVKMKLSPYKLNNGFKGIYGMGVTEWMLEARMEQAHRMLMDTDELVSSIAQASGYTYPQAFTLAFSKYFGYTPAFVQKNAKRPGKPADE